MGYWQEKFSIGSLKISRFIGGPLDGITDSPFRKLVRKFSKNELLYTEMRHVGTVANDKGKAKALAFDQIERPLSYQVSANYVDHIQKACERIIQSGVDCIDLNIGCPARNVVNSKSGSYLMSDMIQLETILAEFRSNLNIPFTVKIRAGYKIKNAIEVAKLIEGCGADAIAIHPRLQTQFFEGIPDYEIAASVKKSIKIPVIFSGGVVNFQTALSTYEKTGVDGFLIGRGIWSRPWKLKELEEHAAGRNFSVDNNIILSCALEHLDNMLEYYGDHGLFCFRKHLPFYLKGRQSASALRKVLIQSSDVNEVKKGLNDFFLQ